MAENAEPIDSAWQPLTFKGVSAFADASLRRLFAVQFVFAVLVASVCVWWLDTAWSPTVGLAIRRMPDRGEIRMNQLQWDDQTPRLLADGHFLALIADPHHTGTIRTPAHLQVELGRNGVRFLSLLGYMDCAYPFGKRVVPFNRTALEPWWGAWRPPILWLSFGLALAVLMIAWSLLSFLLAGPAWLVAFLANRQLTVRAGWKLAGAAMMPGALLMTVAILLYGMGVLDLLPFLAATGVHLMLDFVYAMATPLSRPRLKERHAGRKKNPFATGGIGDAPKGKD